MKKRLEEIKGFAKQKGSVLMVFEKHISQFGVDDTEISFTHERNFIHFLNSNFMQICLYRVEKDIIEPYPRQWKKEWLEKFKIEYL